MIEKIVFLLVLFIILTLVVKNWKKILVIMTGWGIIEFFNFFYENPFWIWMQFKFGILWGSIYCSIGAIIVNVILVIWYQRTGVDWLGVDVFEEIKKDGDKWIERISKHNKWYIRIPSYPFAKLFQLLLWLLKKDDIFTFIAFSIFTDSFVTTTFMRHGKFGKLTMKDWNTFIASVIISCVTWSLWCAFVLEIVKKIILMIHGMFV
jgi:hypothetical protein